MADLKQIKVGSTTYNIEPYTSYLPLTGGTLSGNLTGKYITGTWLRTTEATDLRNTPSNYCVIDDSGWLYKRTLAETKSDLAINNVDNTADANKTVNKANLLNPHQNVTYTDKSIWDPTNSGKIIWGQRFINSSISSDSGDWTLYLRGADSGTELCMNIDGDYYSNGHNVIHSGNIGWQSVNYANSAGSVAWGNVTGKPNSYTPSNHSHLTADIRDIWDFAAQKNHKHTIANVSGLQSALDECKAAANAASHKADVMADHTTTGIDNIDRTPGKFRVLGFSPVTAENWHDDNVVLTGKALYWLAAKGVLDGPNNIKSISFGSYRGPYTAGTSNKTIGQLSGGVRGAFYVIWGRETREHGHISVQKKTTFYEDYDCVGFASGDHGYWGKSDLTLTVYVPADSTYYLFGQNVEKVYINYYQLN